MIKRIEEAILKYNLSRLEEFYFDENKRLRARGFIYDEDTGIFINSFGALEVDLPTNESYLENVRQILDFNLKVPVEVTEIKLTNEKIVKEAVA